MSEPAASVGRRRRPPVPGARLVLSATLVALAGLFGVPGAADAQESPPPPPERPLTLFSPPEAPAPSKAAGAPGSPLAPQDAGFLGVAIENLSADEAEELGLSEPLGVRIQELLDESPAAEAGLQEGDVILEWDGETVSSVLQLQRMVRETPPGRSVPIAYLRDGERSRLTVTVGERRGTMTRFRVMDEEEHRALRERMEELREHATEESRKARKEAADAHRKARIELRRELREGEAPMVFHATAHLGPRIGVRLSSLTEQLAGYFGLDEQTGALVVSVDDDSPAREAGIQAGDVILSAGGSKVDSPGDVARAVREAEGEDLEIRLLRRGDRLDVAVTVPESEGPSAMIISPDEMELEVRDLEPAMRDLEVRLRRIEPRIRRSLEELGPRIRMLRPALERGFRSGVVII